MGGMYEAAPSKFWVPPTSCLLLPLLPGRLTCLLFGREGEHQCDRKTELEASCFGTQLLKPAWLNRKTPPSLPAVTVFCLPPFSTVVYCTVSVKPQPPWVHMTYFQATFWDGQRWKTGGLLPSSPSLNHSLLLWQQQWWQMPTNFLGTLLFVINWSYKKVLCLFTWSYQCA